MTVLIYSYCSGDDFDPGTEKEVVGVFEDRARAEEVAKEFSKYHPRGYRFTYVECKMNEVRDRA